MQAPVMTRLAANILLSFGRALNQSIGPPVFSLKLRAGIFAMTVCVITEQRLELGEFAAVRSYGSPPSEKGYTRSKNSHMRCTPHPSTSCKLYLAI